MEHASFGDGRNATFCITEEDHTLANSLRFILNQDPRVIFCGYSIPHPSDAKVNIRVQTTGEPAREVLKDSCQDLMLMCQHVRRGFDKAVTEFKRNNSSRMQFSKDMDLLFFPSVGTVLCFSCNKLSSQY